MSLKADGYYSMNFSDVLQRYNELLMQEKLILSSGKAVCSHIKHPRCRTEFSEHVMKLTYLGPRVINQMYITQETG